MPSSIKETIFLGLINVLLSAVASTLSSLNYFPLGVPAGLKIQFVLIAIFGAGFGTLVAVEDFRRKRLLVVMIPFLMVPAFMYYAQLMALGGLRLGERYLAAFIYFFIYFAVFFFFTYLERRLIRDATQIPPAPPPASNS